MTVSLEQAGKRYRVGGPWVLRDVSVSVPAGAVVDVRGVNGAGKSTLLRLLAGATVPTRGRRVGGASVGYAPERLVPAPPFSGRVLLRHHARLRGLPRAEGERRGAALAERLQATALLDERLGALSKGSLQKLTLLQALLGRPDLLVLDEPFSGLDTAARAALRELIGEHAAAGGAIVLCDHGESGERVGADVAWELRDGALRVVADATAAAAGATPGAATRELAALPGVRGAARHARGDERRRAPRGAARRARDE